MPGERLLFVTGRLAEYSLRKVVHELSSKVGFTYEISVVGISVAALMHVDWLARKLQVPAGFDRVILPGWCQGDLQALSRHFDVGIELGPKDLFDLPEYFGRRKQPAPSLDEYDIEILAEINHAPKLSDQQILDLAGAYRDSGADLIDIGCIPGAAWPRVGEVTRLLRAAGHRVSIDSFNRHEVETAVEAGAELVLSCNGENVDWAAQLAAEVVAIPDDPSDLDSLARTIDHLQQHGARYRIDPVLEPIGFGFAASLARYFEVRRRWPEDAMMMGIGNLTELTDVDTAGVNMLLAGICQELGIFSVLTTEVINWARTAVREFDLARRIVRHSVRNRVLPKHVDERLIALRDTKLTQRGAAGLEQLASRLKDPNFRIFAERGQLHVMNRDGYWQGTDPYELFDRAAAATPGIDPAHAFYLGYELAKAATALTLGKQYVQDEPLNWGFLTEAETSAIERRKHRGGAQPS